MLCVPNSFYFPKFYVEYIVNSWVLIWVDLNITTIYWNSYANPSNYNVDIFRLGCKIILKWRREPLTLIWRRCFRFKQWLNYSDWWMQYRFEWGEWMVLIRLMKYLILMDEYIHRYSLTSLELEICYINFFQHFSHTANCTRVLLSAHLSYRPNIICGLFLDVQKRNASATIRMRRMVFWMDYFLNIINIYNNNKYIIPIGH